MDGYINGNPEFRGERAGSNDSDEDNFVEGDGWDNYFRLRFKYLLPLGHGKDQIIDAYELDQGLLKSGASGATSWNPLVSGKSYLELRPFYRSQQIEGDDVDEDLKTNGADFSFFWDNRDFLNSPSRGNGLNLKVSRDFGWLDSSDSWTSLQGEFDVYFPLKLSDSFRQEVLAFDFWTSYSPSWEEQSDGTVDNGPPAYTGATLGGLWRMRGYPSQRFSDKAAIYYTAELRVIPRWNPFVRWPTIQKHLGVQWLQFVPFVEVGRVAPSWNMDELHSDMKWDGGVGIRALLKGIVARIDTAVSGEGFSVQMMVCQPFQF
jgi:outer membrane protein assembly factor BamA